MILAHYGEIHDPSIWKFILLSLTLIFGIGIGVLVRLAQACMPKPPVREIKMTGLAVRELLKKGPQ